MIKSKRLLSLPPNMVGRFNEFYQPDDIFERVFCVSDPPNERLESGGGTIWLLNLSFKKENSGLDFRSWLAQEKRIIVHAGGQSRRVPAYAPTGKLLIPLPFGGEGRTLLANQLPLYDEIMNMAPNDLHTLIASGDIILKSNKLPEIPDADVVCYSIKSRFTQIQNHGAFMTSKDHPQELEFMLQKPSVETLTKLSDEYNVTMDVGV